MRDWQQFPVTHKINWVSNCVKHKDGFPTKEPKPLSFLSVNEFERIKLTPEEFRKDCDESIKYYPIFLQMTLSFGQAKMMLETVLNEKDYKDSPDLYKKQQENISKVDEQLKLAVETMKKIKTSNTI